MSDWEFCLCICLAAKKCHIKAKWEDGAVVFADPGTRVYVRGPADPDKKRALYLACVELTNYFNS